MTPHTKPRRKTGAEVMAFTSWRKLLRRTDEECATQFAWKAYTDGYIAGWFAALRSERRKRKGRAK